jgi:hypothetical protein
MKNEKHILTLIDSVLEKNSQLELNREAYISLNKLNVHPIIVETEDEVIFQYFLHVEQYRTHEM